MLGPYIVTAQTNREAKNPRCQQFWGCIGFDSDADLLIASKTCHLVFINIGKKTNGISNVVSVFFGSEELAFAA